MKATFTVHETEDSITRASAAWDDNFRNRLNYERQVVLTQAINAWRINPIARRIIEMQTEFVLGDGFGFNTSNPRLERELARFWHHPLNDLDAQLPEWADEAWRTGDLFVLVSVDAGGMPYVRLLPSETIDRIETRDNDYRQETAYLETGIERRAWQAYDPGEEQAAFVLHFPLNRAAGANFGESDLAPLLYWISIYKQWLEDRARINKIASLFTYVLQKKFASAEEQHAYSVDFSVAMPKTPGAILVLNEDETLSSVTAGLNAAEGSNDGLALKKMIATGAGLPLHFLAEPESATRTTAESAGTPTFKRFQQRQVYLRRVVHAVCLAAMQVRRRFMRGFPADLEFEITCADVTEHDNSLLAIGAQRIVNAFAPLYNARLVSGAEVLRLVYRFIGEAAPENATESGLPMNARGTGKPLPDKEADEKDN